MKNRKVLLAFVSIPLLSIASCSSENAESTDSQTTGSGSTSQSPSSSSSTRPAPTTNTAAPTTPQSEPQDSSPYVSECLAGPPGASLMSDGTVQTTTFCKNQAAVQESQAAESATGTDLSQIPFANGGTCPAYKCGYGTDENGVPNPSSGEIQSWWIDCIATNPEIYCRENDPYR